MSKKLIIKWIKPPHEEVAKHGMTLELINLNVIWHDEEDVEVTEFFQYPDPKSKATTILGREYAQAKRAVRGDPHQVYSQIFKNISDKETFQKKWDAAKHLFLSRSPFVKASSEAFLNYVNNYGMTPKKFAEKTGVENSVLFRELKGQRKLSLDKAITYSKALACDPVDLLFDKQMCSLWGSVDLFNMHQLGNDDYWIGQIKAAPILKESKNEGGLLGNQLIPVPRDIYRPEIRAILIDSLGSHLHNHFVYYYRTDQSDEINENKLVVVGREIPEFADYGMDTMQYFFGILKIEKGKQKLLNPEPTSDKKELATGPFSFIAPVVSIVKRGAMKKDHSYFESIEQSEKIKEAMDKQVRLQMEINKAIAKIQDDTKRIALTQKDIEKIRESTRVKKLFRDLQEIPEFIRKKVG